MDDEERFGSLHERWGDEATFRVAYGRRAAFTAVP